MIVFLFDTLHLSKLLGFWVEGLKASIIWGWFFLHSISYNLIFVCMKALAYIFWAWSQDESFCLVSSSPWCPGLCQNQTAIPVRNCARDPEPPQAWCPATPPAHRMEPTSTNATGRARRQGQCCLESDKWHLVPCPDELFITLEKGWAWDLSVSMENLRQALVITGWDYC